MDHQDRTSRVSPPGPPGGPSSTLHDREPAEPDPRVEGTLLGGRYRVQECIGAGAMGVVWTAWDRRLARTVAVKQLTPPRDGDPVEVRTARSRAMREGRIAARVVHPRAIAVFDVVIHSSMPWLVMEYLPSRSLAAVLAERGPLPPPEVARIGAQIADALSAVHEAGIVHGDVKPGNVLLTDDGVAKLTDFGVSRASWDTSATGGGVVAGTPGYFAPEVARGGDPTPASDVFSLGATLYAAVENELVCGRMDNTLAVLHAMAEGRLRPATRAGVLGRPLSAMLRLDPSHRPDTALVRAALEARAARGAPTAGVGAVPPAVASPDTPATSTPAADAAPDDPSTADVRGPAVTSGPPTAPWVGVAGGPADEAADPPHDPEDDLVPGGLRAAAPTPGPGARRRRRRVLAVAAASAVVLAAGVGAAVAAVDPPHADRAALNAAAPPPDLVPTTAAPPPTAVPSETVPPVAGAPLSPGSSTSAAPDGLDGAPGDPVSEDDVRRTVSTYYGSLPGDIPGAWTLLSGDAQDASGGYDGYQRFWSGITSVSADDVQVDGSSARADLRFVTTSGRTSHEAYTFEVDRNAQGRLEIRSASRGGADSA
ncbi:serine/threonine-protein kinase [Actinomycetospora sp. TBRC 11914]|uniref:serine/threonine-protein kinase n=1 Tax=Actinomycetospora sp. TBRC 11914 TaxID=2729387 RepID=UPI00145D74C8|nr:serine/threonine-protein kinase [Actinomycetospora sp. TBRC 11914]NMO92847.1 serine/threonine protein kinase [Actinomycetospora sp. TBRC 11914]